MQYRAAAASRPPALQRTKGEEKGESVSVLVKGDVVGSVEVLVGVLQTRQPQGVALSVVHSGVGPVCDSDVETAASTGSELPQSSTSPRSIPSWSGLRPLQVLFWRLECRVQRQCRLWPGGGAWPSSHTTSSTNCWVC